MSEKSNLFLAADILGIKFEFNATSGNVTGHGQFQPPGFDFTYRLEVEHRFQMDGPVEDVVMVLAVGSQASPKTHLNMILDIQSPGSVLLTLVSKARLPREFKRWTDIDTLEDLYKTLEPAVLRRFVLEPKTDQWLEEVA